MKLFLKPLIGLAAAGLVASIVVHVCALLRIQNPFGNYAWGLHGGIFVVWIPAVLITTKATSDLSIKRKDFWKVALSGCPSWMRSMVYGFFIYAVINFIFFIYRTAGRGHGPVDPSIEFRGFSGHWMAFYAAALALFYSATRQVEAKCANGHPASPLAKFCDRCGTPVTTRDPNWP
jgi:hypothetical protein